ncbi:MAG: peptidylprolyl isomerase [Syntrophobacterales bacterium]|nr:peptidylprolyl isomerase [Syntrophobacterales bacterium]
MAKKIGRYVTIAAVFAFIFGITVGCDANAEKDKTVKQIMAPAGNASAALPAGQNAAPAAKVDGGATAVEVDGLKLTNAEVAAQVEQKLAQIAGQIPPERLEQARGDIRKGIIDGFVNLTLLKKEIATNKVAASEKEITAFIEEVKANMPPGQTIEGFMQQNSMDMAKFREEVGNNIKIKKLIQQEAGGSLKATDKEINDFYATNKQMFLKPESVHARHILVASEAKDDEKTKAQKLAKAEGLRKKLVAGEDFAQLAAKDSDCPSKEKGGDLGTFGRGQMVKPFEDAAFSQAPKAIGPIVKTDFGFHIIQVLEHKASETLKLDGEMKKKIAAFMERQKQEENFEKMMKRLKTGTKIVING